MLTEPAFAPAIVEFESEFPFLSKYDPAEFIYTLSPFPSVTAVIPLVEWVVCAVLVVAVFEVAVWVVVSVIPVEECCSLDFVVVVAEVAV